MGEYFLIVNTAKKQFLDPGRFGENTKWSGILEGAHGAVFARLLRHGPVPSDGSRLAGSWAGDPIYITGDESPPDPELSTTSDEEPERNLNRQAKEEFLDISQKAIAMLADDDRWADRLAASAKDDADLLVELGQAIFRLKCKPLQKALERALGSAWIDQYKTAREKSSRREGYRITSGPFKHTLLVADLLGAPDLAKVFLDAGLPVHVALFPYIGEAPLDGQPVRVGTQIPVELAVKSLKIARKVWPFLKYVAFYAEDAPGAVQNSVFFGGATVKVTSLGVWTEKDFEGLRLSMTAAEFQSYVKERYNPNRGKESR